MLIRRIAAPLVGIAALFAALPAHAQSCGPFARLLGLCRPPSGAPVEVPEIDVSSGLLAVAAVTAALAFAWERRRRRARAAEEQKTQG